MPGQDIPLWMQQEYQLQDEFQTKSSELVKQTAKDCLPFLFEAIESTPELAKQKHVVFLTNMLGRLPNGYTGLDASRPWILYWTLMALSLLGHEVSRYRESVIATLRPIQSVQGGFGGGHGQMAHLATTYAALLSLTLVGGNAIDMVDRDAMWHWLGSLKQAEGDFAVAVGGERDVRGAYCVMIAIDLLGLSKELPEDATARESGHNTFESGLAEYISTCQTYEGGLGSVPGAEAHGSFTFCGLACLCLLGDPKEIMHKYLDVDALVFWLSARQHSLVGGLAGRSNKLVDGCYSHWIGGCYTLVEAAIRDETNQSIWNKDALTRYILCCAQSPRGGLRDKPGMRPDAYHTCYNLAGLSATQHRFTHNSPLNDNQAQKKLVAHAWEAVPREAYTHDGIGIIHPVLMTSFDASQNILHSLDANG